MLNIAVFGSGRGSNFKAILNAIADRQLPDTRIVLVVSNNSDAGILDLARAARLPHRHMSRKQYSTEESFVADMLAALRASETNLIVLAGYMKHLPAPIVTAYHHRILNVHPALLPKFGGKGMYGPRVHEAVLASREALTGATVHVVDEVYDHGPIVLQRTVPVLDTDSPESLAARVLEMEHHVLPEALRLFAEGRVSVIEGQPHVQIRPV